MATKRIYSLPRISTQITVRAMDLLNRERKKRSLREAGHVSLGRLISELIEENLPTRRSADNQAENTTSRVA
jgi:hypothetical protein